MEQNPTYITINHLEFFGGYTNFRVGDQLYLQKDHDNPYDDEAILAYDSHNIKCGYVANSVSTVARGTYSAGRVYDRIPDEEKCIIRFITEECLIGEISPLINPE